MRTGWGGNLGPCQFRGPAVREILSDSPEGGTRRGGEEGASATSSTVEVIAAYEGDRPASAGSRCTAADRKRFVDLLLDLCPGLQGSLSNPETTEMGARSPRSCARRGRQWEIWP